MAAPHFVPAPAGRHPAFTAASLWYLDRKLSRRTRADFARMTFKVVAIRLYSAAACAISMLLTAWLGAFARNVSAHDWHVFRTLDGTTLLVASTQADRYQADLLPVILCWAALLLLTPRGYTFAFRAAAVAAGILGYLRFSPPSFLVTTRVSAVSRWLIRFDGRATIPYLVLVIALVYVLLSSAANTFGHLDQLRKSPHRVPHDELYSAEFIRRLCAIPLIMLVLLSAIWAVTVVRLASSGASFPGVEISYSFQGKLYPYLFLLVLISVAVSRINNGGNWLIAAVILTTWYNLVPSALAFPSILEISADRTQLIHISTAWGSDSLWAALFIFIPAVVLGIYLVARLLRSP